MKDFKIILVPGHTQNQKGSYSETYDFYEFDYNPGLIEEIYKNHIMEDMDNLNMECYDWLDYLIFVKIIRQVPLINFVKTLNSIYNDHDLIIEFHNNAWRKNKATGVEILIGRKYRKNNLLLKYSEYFLKRFAKKFKFRNRGIKIVSDQRNKNGSYKSKGGYILNETAIPSIIFELGFIDNDIDAKKLLDQKDQIAKEIFESFKFLVDDDND